jgi:thymidylate kinase
MPQNLVESGHRAPVRMGVKANVARLLLDALSTQCKAYCILSGYERLPDNFDSDIDFMVDQQDFDRMPQIIEEVARKTGTQLFQSIDHELTGRAYFLGSLDGPSLTIIQPDCAADYRHFGRRWLTAREVLAARRLHPNGFYIPSTAHEFAYSLVKRLNKRSFNREHGYKLHRLYVEDRIECGRMIARFCRGPEGSAIVRMCSSNDWTAMCESIEPFRAAMLRSHKESWADRLRAFPAEALHVLRRIVQPTGCWIAFMGPDGCGKSLVLSSVSREFAPSFRKVSYFHLRPKLIGRRPKNQGPVTDPHGQPPRGTLASIAKVADLWLDYTLGFLARILPGVMRTELVLFDRCFYDLLVDSKRIRYGGPPWLLRTAARLSPGPDLVILLDAPPEVLRARKQEVPLAETARQRTAYLDLARGLKSAVVVNAAQSPENVVHDAITAIMDHLGRRTRKRLGIPAAFGRNSGPNPASAKRTW